MTKAEAIKIVRQYFPKARVVKQKFNQYDSQSANPSVPKIVIDHEISIGPGRRFAWGAKTPESAWIQSAESILKNKHIYDNM